MLSSYMFDMSVFVKSFFKFKSLLNCKINNFLQSKTSKNIKYPIAYTSCNSICYYCDVEISERAASAICMYLDKKILTLDEKDPIKTSLIFERDAIMNGCWNDYYDFLIKKDDKK